MITGATPVKERQRLFEAFRSGEVGLLVVSKVANFSIDLPTAEVAIQVSGSFGSRQEEAQRLGRLLRPKTEGKTAHFYTIVSRDTVDAEFAANRQRFLAEQGYAYRIVDAEDLPASAERADSASAVGRNDASRSASTSRMSFSSQGASASPPTGWQPDDDPGPDVEGDVVVVGIVGVRATPPGLRRGRRRSRRCRPASL